MLSSRPSTAISSHRGSNATASHLGKDTSRLMTSRSSIMSKDPAATARSTVSATGSAIGTSRTRRLIPPLKGMNDSLDLEIPKPVNPRPRSENDIAHDNVLTQLNSLKISEHKWATRALEIAAQMKQLQATLASVNAQIEQHQAGCTALASNIPLIARGEPVPCLAPSDIDPDDANNNANDPLNLTNAASATVTASSIPTATKDRPSTRRSGKEDPKAIIDPIAKLSEADRAAYHQLCESLTKIYRTSDKKRNPETGEEMPRKAPKCPAGMDPVMYENAMQLRAERFRMEKELIPIKQRLETHLRHQENLQKIEALNRYALEHDQKELARLSTLLLQHKQTKMDEDTIWITGKPLTPPVIAVEPPKKNTRKTRVFKKA